MPALERAVATTPRGALPSPRLQAWRRWLAVTADLAGVVIAFSGKPPNIR